MFVVEVALRAGAVALLALLAALLVRDARRTPAGVFGALLALGVAAYVVRAGLPPALTAWWLWPLKIASFGNPVCFWLLASAIFDDEFRPDWRHASAWGGLVAANAGCEFAGLPLANVAAIAVSLLFVALGAAKALVGHGSDLVEGRRRFRLVFVIATASYILVDIVAQTLLRGTPAFSTFNAVNALGIFAMSFVFAGVFLSVSRDGPFVTGTSETAVSISTPRKPRDGESAPSLADRQDELLLERLARLMDVDKVYRQEGLGIAALAAKLDLPEYRLRRLINRHLGHRNFTAYLNAYRLSDAMAALADPTQVKVPVLTIALDAGFQSIGPFNRAFKARTGMTPTEYRRRHLHGIDALAAE